MQEEFNCIGGKAMDYYKIGQRIRKYRKAFGLSQEALAERIGISVPHMSHIETGNTKLSLPVLVALAQALEVRTDDLLFDGNHGERSELYATLEGELRDCSAEELALLSEILRSVRLSLKKHGTFSKN